jgi:N-acetylneuraminate synthase
MSSWAELDAAVNVVLRRHKHIVVLQCTSEYPCPVERVGLNVMIEMRERYGLPVGLSDHTLTPYLSYAAVALGAEVVERHVTFSRKMYGSDAGHSMEPAEFAELVRGIRTIERALSTRIDKDDLCGLREMKKTFEKSIVALVAIPAGVRIEREMVGIKRPGIGLAPSRLEQIIGRRTVRKIEGGCSIVEEDIDWV